MRLKEAGVDKKKRTGLLKRIIIRVVILIFLTIFFWFENKHLVVTNYIYSTSEISEDMDGFRIVQISDLHNASFGKGNSRLISKIKEQHPNIIVLTGDLVDSNFTNIDRALDFAEKACDICPVFYVTGNHEYWLEEDELSKLLSGLKDRGVRILDNEGSTLAIGDGYFNLIGIDDNNLMDKTVRDLLEGQEDSLNVVLAHEPDYIENYARAKADLVLTGHAHGGQFRLPFIGGVVAPGQGLNPKYTEGIHIMDKTAMIVSRGLGNSIIPVRLFNDPEIVVVELRAE